MTTYRLTILSSMLLAASACVDLSQPWKGVSGMGGQVGGSASGGSEADAPLAEGGAIGAGGASNLPPGSDGAGSGVTTVDSTVSMGAGGQSDLASAADAAPGPDLASSSGGATGSAGLSASGGTASGGVRGTGGASPLGGTLGLGGASPLGGMLGLGGASPLGGTLGLGGAPAAAGRTGTGGASAAGGTTATGGKAAAGGAQGSGGVTGACGSTKSTFRESLQFEASVNPLSVAATSLSSSTTLTFSTTGPSSNSSLCTKGCAVFSVHFSDGVAANAGSQAVRIFDAPVDLVGTTVTFSYAIDNPSQVPIRMQVYVTGDAPNWAWGPPASIEGSGLAAYSAASGFASEALSPTDNPNGYCASATKLVGLQVQNMAAITSTTAGTVTIYIASLGISAP